MKRRRLFWKIYPYYVIIIVVSLILTAFFGAREMRSMYMMQVTDTLEARARLVTREVSMLQRAGDVNRFDQVCREASSLSQSRISIVDKSGKVLGDSHKDIETMENHSSRPEIIEAFRGHVGISTRFSNTLQTTMTYVAVPVNDSMTIWAVVRLSVPVSAVEVTLSTFYRNIASGGLLIVLLAALVSVFLVRRLSGPLRELRDGAGRFASGNFDTRLMLPNTEEIADVAKSMNSMAAQLDGRIRTIAAQRNEREAILTSMSEGVLALDAEGRIVSLNRVASDLLELDPEQIRGKAIYETIRLSSLLEFAERAQTSTDLTEAEITLPGATERYLQLRGAMLKDTEDRRVGTVLVLNDITRLKKLEGIRREFVANVSHELKTPITAITGSVETLLDQEAMSAEDSKRFLEMISRQSERLNSLIEDLLSLAKLESESEQDEMVMSRGSLADLLQASMAACHEKSVSREIQVNLSCEADLVVNMNRDQLEQAFVNLLDNAIKYSETRSAVDIVVSREETEVSIAFTDRGQGIPPEHLPRLFERFYRVDHARSRELGGTGLGLSIVKHIALEHGGRVGVESTAGSGSTFTIYLPVL